jgi:hypothetical protein
MNVSAMKSRCQRIIRPWKQPRMFFGKVEKNGFTRRTEINGWL